MQEHQRSMLYRQAERSSLFALTVIAFLSLAIIHAYNIPSSTRIKSNTFDRILLHFNTNTNVARNAYSRRTRSIQYASPQLSITSDITLSSLQPGQPTELPDSLSDAAIRAAEATKAYYDVNTGGIGGGTTSLPVRCRVDFDTSIGDETFTLLKQSTEFMQQYVTALSYALIPELLQQRQNELMAVIQAKNELQLLSTQKTDQSNYNDSYDDEKTKEQREDELVQLIANNGRNGTNPNDTTEATTAATTTTASAKRIKKVIRIYFPDEGSAALARRDWTMNVPSCVEYASCNGRQPLPLDRNAQTAVVVVVVAQVFFCPRASDSEALERILSRTEDDAMNAEPLRSSSLLSVFVNPILVDMGVTGFGLAGRRLRERLIDPLMGVYYLRTLPWGAITRQWPSSYTIWQEDTSYDGGYKCIANCNNRLPSNPEVIDIYDMANSNTGNPQESSKSGGVGFFGQIGDFVNGMMRL
jgi:Domain of unknown function (DUF1995)